MFRRWLASLLCLGVMACASDRPDFAPRGDESSGSSGANSQAGDADGGATMLATTGSNSTTAEVNNTSIATQDTLVSSGNTTGPFNSGEASEPKPPNDSGSGETDAGVPCDDACKSGEARCSDGELERCEVDSRGCFAWGERTKCDSAACATKTSCIECDDRCAVGDTACSDGSLRTCVADELGCLDWSEPSACATQTCASETACFVCDDSCNSGDYSCNGSQLLACTADEKGCYQYAVATTCEGNTPVCNASAERCECSTDAAPTCTDSATVSRCVNGAWVDSTCTGDIPVCVNGVGCSECTEHSQCPQSACHLSGSKQGTCFAMSSVVNVNSAAALLNAVNATSTTGESVIKLSAGTYTMTSELGPKGETAIIGQPGVVIVDNMPPPSDGRAAFIYSSETTYLAKFELQNTSANHAGFSGYSGSIVWVDDVRIQGEATVILTYGECHVRRSSMYDCGSGALAYYGGSLFIENSTIGPPRSGSQTTGVGAISGAVLDVRYSTIVGHHWGVGCSIGQSGGRITNSIIASELNGYSIADDYGDCSQAFTLSNNAIDQPGYGTSIATYNPNWFVGASTGNLHLSNAGKVAIPAVATRGSGDPIVDIDGDPRPASAGYPGADEP